MRLANSWIGCSCRLSIETQSEEVCRIDFVTILWLFVPSRPQSIRSFFSHFPQPDWWKFQPCLPKCKEVLNAALICPLNVKRPVLPQNFSNDAPTLYFLFPSEILLIQSDRFIQSSSAPEKCLNNSDSNPSNVYFETHLPSLSHFLRASVSFNSEIHPCSTWHTDNLHCTRRSNSL